MQRGDHCVWPCGSGPNTGKCRWCASGGRERRGTREVSASWRRYQQL